MLACVAGKPPFTTVHKGLIGIQVVGVLLMAAVALVDIGGSDGWADLARVAVAVLLVIFLVGLLVVALIARYLTAHPVLRGVILVAGPIGMTFLGILALRF